MITFYSHNIWNNSPAGYRTKLLRSLMDDFDADVCAFQECSPQRNRQDLPTVEEVMCDKYAETLPQFADVNFTPIFYKKDKFNVIDGGYFPYAGLNDLGSKSVSWAILEDKETLERFAFAATHFWWMARGEEDSNQRVENAKQLKEVCDNIVEKYNLPVFIGGDFNNGKNTNQGDAAYYAMLDMGFVDIRSIAKDCTDVEFTCQSAVPVLQDDESFLPVPIDANMCIDYIFVYGDFKGEVKKFYIETNDKARTASDHCPLIAEIEF